AAAARAVAAVRAGWRGSVAGIARRAVRHLKRVFGVCPEDLYAALGPAIGGCCYEVDRSIVDALEAHWDAMPEAVRGRQGDKAMLDLRDANAAILARAGVPESRIARVGPCTKCAAADWFSHRAAGGPTGRQLSVIGWRR